VRLRPFSLFSPPRELTSPFPAFRPCLLSSLRRLSFPRCLLRFLPLPVVGSPESDSEKKNVVVVGSSFIGMEVALALADKAKVTVVGMDEVPFEKILGKAVGNGIRKVRCPLFPRSLPILLLSPFAPRLLRLIPAYSS
jgi:NADPH-dependent 2,4-dienoyl-CoA reductase/sulfur reductase-like enzyme